MNRTLKIVVPMLVSVLFSGAAMAAPQPEAGLGLPRDVSVEGHRIDWLIGITNYLTAAFFGVMVIWIVWAALVHNKDATAKYDHGSDRKGVFKVLGMAGLVFFTIDANLFFNSTVDLETTFHNFDKVEKDPSTIRVEVNAHQWAWDFRYAGPDGKFNTKDDIESLHELKIPVNTPILFEVTSTDVLHSLNFPNLRAKVDAVPGQVNRVWIMAKEIGDFDIVCAQHCGTNHYKMRGELSVLSKEDYAKWAAEASAIAERAYNDADEDAHWGWDWKVE